MQPAGNVGCLVGRFFLIEPFVTGARAAFEMSCVVFDRLFFDFPYIRQAGGVITPDA